MPVGKTTADVVIVGGGIAGLYAAVACVDRGISVILLEREARLGGRIRTVQRAGVNYDAGAWRIARDHPLAMDLVRRFGLVTHAPSPRSQFVVCHDGLGDMVERMYGFLRASGRARIFTNTVVQDVHVLQSPLSDRTRTKPAKHVVVHATDFAGNPRRYTAYAGLCAIPSQDAMTLPSLASMPQLQALEPVSIHKIVGRFAPGAWPTTMGPARTRLPLQEFAPVDRQQGLAVLSYSKGTHADYWKRVADRSDRELRRELRKQLHVVFPEVPLPRASWVASHYWPHGTHAWRSDAPYDAERVQHILGREVPVYLVGEAYSQHHGWIEGALATVQHILPDLWRRITSAMPSAASAASAASTASAASAAYAGGDGGSARAWLRQHAMGGAAPDLSAFRLAFPNIAWVTLTDPADGKKKLLDVTDWMNHHPGGTAAIASRLYQDITPAFSSIGAHKGSQLVAKQIRKCTLTSW